MKKLILVSILAISSVRSAESPRCLATTVSAAAVAQLMCSTDSLSFNIESEESSSKVVLVPDQSDFSSFSPSLSPNSQHIALLASGANTPQSVRIFDLNGENDSISYAITSGKGTSRFSVMALCNRARQLVGGLFDTPLGKHDLEQGRETWRMPTAGHTQSLAVSGDGSRVVQGVFNDREAVALWDTRSNKRSWDVAENEPVTAGDVAISDDCLKVAALLWGDPKNRVKVWDMRQNKLLNSFASSKSTKLYRIAFRVDGSSVRCASIRDDLEVFSLTEQ